MQCKRITVRFVICTLTGLKNDIDEAEKTLTNVQAGEALRGAIRRRHLGDLEKSMAHIRKNGWEKDWGIELKEGEKLANRLKRLEKLKAEIMELKQSVISEIRSYQNPPPAVHKVQCTCKGTLRTVMLQLVHWTPARVVLIRALAWVIVLCSYARHFTLTVPLSTQE